jgi:predicted O-methyltransferase YrrM
MGEIIYENQLSYLSSLRNENDSLILEMEAFAKEARIPILDWLSAELLVTLIVSQKPKRVLEIGTAIGYSTIKIAQNLSKRGTIHTIEKSRDNILLANENFQKSGLIEKIRLYEGDALSVMPQLNKKYDFIFLDADKEDYENLLDYSIMLLNKRGILFVDNLLWHGHTAAQRVPPSHKKSTEQIRKFNKKFMQHPKLKSTILSVGDGIGLGVRV